MNLKLIKNFEFIGSLMQIARVAGRSHTSCHKHMLPSSSTHKIKNRPLVRCVSEVSHKRKFKDSILKRMKVAQLESTSIRKTG